MPNRYWPSISSKDERGNAYAFIAAERPPFPKLSHALVHEMATQTAEAEGLERPKAQEIAAATVSGVD